MERKHNELGCVGNDIVGGLVSGSRRGARVVRELGPVHSFSARRHSCRCRHGGRSGRKAATVATTEVRLGAVQAATHAGTTSGVIGGVAALHLALI